jgi:hypothetical protein
MSSSHFPKAKATNVLSDKFCRKNQITNCIRENFYRVDAYTQLFVYQQAGLQINLYLEQPMETSDILTK